MAIWKFLWFLFHENIRYSSILRILMMESHDMTYAHDRKSQKSYCH